VADGEVVSTDRALAALLWFWLFAALPRLAAFVGVGSLTGEIGPAGALWTVIVGLLRDGLPLGLAILAVVLWRWWRSGGRSGGRVAHALGSALALALALVLAGLFADSRFFRYFGFHAGFDHLGLLRDWRAVAPSLVHYLRQPVVWVGLVAVPAGYLLAVWRWPPRRLLARCGACLPPPHGLALPAVALAVGLAAGWLPLPSAAADNLADNWLVAALSGGGDNGGKLASDGHGDLPALLDTRPLPRAGAVEPPWLFPDPQLPLIKATEHQLCRLGKLTGAPCAVDADGDGFPVASDCNDLVATIHPGAEEVARNGIDEDCSGLDAEPPSFLFIHWEGARAVNVGSLGYDFPSSPRFDALAARGVLFRNAYANGTTTRSSLISVYASLLPRFSTRWIFAHHPELELLAFPELLRERGYHTIYLHGGYIELGGKLPRFTRWFESRFDRTTPAIAEIPGAGWGLADEDLFDLAWQVLENRPDDRPFLLTLATLSLHHPFELPPGAAALRDPQDPRHAISNLIHYSDQALGDFLDRVLADPRFADLAIVVWADHGINWHAPHPQFEQNLLWEDLVWVPIALLGQRWGQPAGPVDEIRQLADLGPTVLDLAGIEAPNPFIGHSLLRRFPAERTPRATFATANGGPSFGLRQEDDKYFIQLDGGLERYFDTRRDRAETDNLAPLPEYRARLDRYHHLLSEIYAANERLILENRVWGGSYRLPPPAPAAPVQPSPGADSQKP
jgi:arylsulfatase A-like enzyme